MYLFYLATLALSCSMWDLVPWPGIEPRPLALRAQSLATGPPGKSTLFIFVHPALSLLKRKYLIKTWPFILVCFSRALDRDEWNPRGNSWGFSRVHYKEESKVSPSSVKQTLRSHGLQHTRLPCPLPSPWVCSNSGPLNPWCHPTISSSVAPFSSFPQFLPASGSY